MVNSKKWPQAKKYTVAALLARSNMGQSPPRDHGALQVPYSHLETAVDSLCGAYMETDEHERIFMREARMWLRDYINKNALTGSQLECVDYYDRNYLP